MNKQNAGGSHFFGPLGKTCTTVLQLEDRSVLRSERQTSVYWNYRQAESCYWNYRQAESWTTNVWIRKSDLYFAWT